MASFAFSAAVEAGSAAGKGAAEAAPEVGRVKPVSSAELGDIFNRIALESHDQKPFAETWGAPSGQHPDLMMTRKTERQAGTDQESHDSTPNTIPNQDQAAREAAKHILNLNRPTNSRKTQLNNGRQGKQMRRPSQIEAYFMRVRQRRLDNKLIRAIALALRKQPNRLHERLIMVAETKGLLANRELEGSRLTGAKELKELDDAVDLIFRHHPESLSTAERNRLSEVPQSLDAASESKPSAASIQSKPAQPMDLEDQGTRLAPKEILKKFRSLDSLRRDLKDLSQSAILRVFSKWFYQIRAYVLRVRRRAQDKRIMAAIELLLNKKPDWLDEYAKEIASELGVHVDHEGLEANAPELKELKNAANLISKHQPDLLSPVGSKESQVPEILDVTSESKPVQSMATESKEDLHQDRHVGTDRERHAPELSNPERARMAAKKILADSRSDYYKGLDASSPTGKRKGLSPLKEFLMRPWNWYIDSKLEKSIADILQHQPSWLKSQVGAEVKPVDRKIESKLNHAAAFIYDHDETSSILPNWLIWKEYQKKYKNLQITKNK
ncbi:hypothetical protein PCANC_23116 [Puccinia coronata f. sp. avenae]|uniref:Uncharacterized protein n=1 Tax=Puccinia coronata f. sp. avenae TaxID=200324 RepID=A0A2N5TSK8_9BASI|nr:hypothetical protein PCANC_28913 [Puccinia coronata f. sp. avenae]PLW28479.1 hypothetical protein PCANC_23116 [Puccinia coronata f. sp. avenae]